MTRRAPHRGFTLLEVGIGLVLLGLFLSVAIPSVGALAGAEVKKTTSMMQGLIRDTFARAALTGSSHRIVFDLDQGAYWVEFTEGGAVLPRERQSPGADGVGSLDFVDERLRGTDNSDDPRDVEKRRLYRPKTWQPVDSEEGKPTRLPNGVALLSVWADHLDNRIQKGQAAVAFFPRGYSQEAQIVIGESEEGGRILTVIVEPLTGETFVAEDVPPLPRLQ